MIWSGASAVALAAALLAAAPVHAAACTKDSQCEFGKVCKSGKCVAKPAAGSAGTAAGSSQAAGGSQASSPAAAPAAAVTAPAAAYRPSAALFGLYSWGGFGLGARVEWPVMPNVLKEVQWKNDLFAVGGVEYYTDSYGGFGFDWRVHFIRIEAGAMWNFWFAENFAAYPKLTLGYDIAWVSGTSGAGASYGGIAFEGAVGVIYNITPVIQLRGEIGNGAIKAGVGIHL